MSGRAWAIAGLGVVCAGLLLIALEVDLPYLETLNTYGNFDVPSDQAFVTYLLPGTEDTALLRDYRFGHGVHWVPILALLVVFSSCGAAAPLLSACNTQHRAVAPIYSRPIS